MTDSRAPIPADIHRRVLVEAGHRCAIPTCRYIEVDIHHIIPWAKSKSHDYDNLIALCPNCHRRADAGEIDRKSLRLYKLNLRFAHDKYSQLEMDILFELARIAPETIFWMPVMLIMLKRLFDSGFINAHRHPHIRAVSGGMDQTPMILQITDKGLQFVNDLGIVEL